MLSPASGRSSNSRPPSKNDARRARLGSGFEVLEDRAVPAIVTYQVNTTDDTHFDHTLMIGGQATPVDTNGNTSLRAAVEYGNANPQNGNWNTDHYTLDLSPVAGGTITLSSAVGFQTISLNTNYNFITTVPGVTIARPAAPNTPAYNHFDVDSNRESHFMGMTMTNGRASTDGGSIWNNGTVNIMSCTFTNNSTPAGGGGGAIYARSGATTLLFSCTFTNNTADNGGAIAADSGSLTTSLSMCTLSQNEAKVNGGAVWSKQAGSLALSSSTINHNKATGITSLGGGVYVEATLSVTIDSTNITYNTSSFNGGGLYVLDCGLTMNNGSLSDNTAAQDGGGFYINADTKTVTFNQVSVTDNGATAGKGGGGYLLQGTLAGSFSLMAPLTGNTSGVAGFAGIAEKAGANATITIPMGQQTVTRDP